MFLSAVARILSLFLFFFFLPRKDSDAIETPPVHLKKLCHEAHHPPSKCIQRYLLGIVKTENGILKVLDACTSHCARSWRNLASPATITRDPVSDIWQAGRYTRFLTPRRKEECYKVLSCTHSWHRFFFIPSYHTDAMILSSTSVSVASETLTITHRCREKKKKKTLCRYKLRCIKSLMLSQTHARQITCNVLWLLRSPARYSVMTIKSRLRGRGSFESVRVSCIKSANTLFMVHRIHSVRSIGIMRSSRVLESL